MLLRASLLAAAVLATFSGCTGQDPVDEQQEIVDNLIQAGYPAQDIQIIDGAVYVGYDAEVSLEASREMLDTSGTAEQYRTNNLVGTGVTKICIVPTSAFSSKPNLSTGLDLAIQNYNQQSLRITFARGNVGGCSAIIHIKVSGPTGGSSGFPSGGQPYGSIQVGSGTNSYGANVCEHVITHEIGHTIGFRHSDYYNRSISCGTGGNEGDGGIGAVLIPGTPSNATVGGSVMNSCFRSTETGEWTSSDITALNALY